MQVQEKEPHLTDSSPITPAFRTIARTRGRGVRRLNSWQKRSTEERSDLSVVASSISKGFQKSHRASWCKRIILQKGNIQTILHVGIEVVVCLRRDGVELYPWESLHNRVLHRTQIQRMKTTLTRTEFVSQIHDCKLNSRPSTVG